MDQNDGMPVGHGRGRPTSNTEVRRPLQYPTYAPPDNAPVEGTNTNGIYQETSWHTGDLSYMASPSGDHFRPMQSMESPGSTERITSNLSPFAKEFVPRNFRPEPRVIAAEVEENSISVLDSYPVQALREFLTEINMNPGKFEKRIQSLTDTLNSMVDDDDTVCAVVNIIFDESIRQSNLRYSGARLCKALCNDFDASPNRLNFRSVLFTRCRHEIKRREDLARLDDNGTYLRGLAMFMAELFSQLEMESQKIPVLGDTMPNLIKTILEFSSPDNLKCACQVLKLVGAGLEDFERSQISNNGEAPRMDSIINSLKLLANATQDAGQTRNNIRDLINSVIKLRDSDWGRGPSHTENSYYDNQPPLSDEPVMYGPDGKPMSADELMFLQSQYASSNMLPEDDYDSLYADDGNDELTDEISEAYEIFLQEQAAMLRH